MDGEAIAFQALIVPHRSLSRRGLTLLLAGIALICATNIGVSIHIHAWPIGGFAGIELFLAAFLLRLNARDVRSSELVMLTGNRLHILRTDVKGHSTQRNLQAGWLNVMLEERPGRVPGLLLVSHGRQEEIGRSMGETEKRALADALTEALRRWRSPEG